MKLRYLLFVLLVAPTWADVEDQIEEAAALRDAAVAIADSAQGVIDSLTAQVRSLEYVAMIDTVYPGLQDSGVIVLPYQDDALYVTIKVDYNGATAEKRLRWREAKLALIETMGKSCLIERRPWEWGVHRADLVKVLSYFNAALNWPEE